MAVQLPATPGGHLQEDVEEPNGTSVTIRAKLGPPICLERRHHFWLCDPMEPGWRGRYQRIGMVCRDCGLQRWREPKPVSRRQEVQFVRVTPQPSAIIDAVPVVSARRSISVDQLLDSLTYSRSGPWRSFVRLASLVDESPWFPQEIARKLGALGHFEVEHSRSTLQAERWSVAPATLVVSADGSRAFLAGSRAAKILQAVFQAAKSLGGALSLSDQDGGPRVVGIRGLDEEGLSQMALSVSKCVGFEVTMSVRCVRTLLQCIPRLIELQDHLPELTISSTSLERFSFEMGAWHRIAAMNEPGAYRVQTRPALYAFLPPPTQHRQNPKAVLCEPRTAKYLAALSEHRALIGYDTRRQQLLAAAGAPLPGLLERAAVLCSGWLPERRGDVIAYRDVPRWVAENIWVAATSKTPRRREQGL